MASKTRLILKEKVTKKTTTITIKEVTIESVGPQDRKSSAEMWKTIRFWLGGIVRVLAILGSIASILSFASN